MAVTINADTVTGAAIVTADASGVLALQGAGVTQMTVSNTGVSFVNAVPLPSGSALTNPTVTNYTETLFTANTGTAFTIDLANGTVQYLTLTGNCTYTFPTPVAGKSFILIQKQDGTGGRTVTWPASVKWPGGTAPTLTSTASKADKFVFTAIDGSNWLGSNAGQNYTV
jgi:hypothetical protein